MSLLRALIIGREKSGRWEAAKSLQRLEFRNESVERVYEMLENGALDR